MVAHVLVVDDDPDLLALADLQLRQHGHKVITASSGKEALELVARDGYPEIAVLDVAMPVMNGLDLLSALRAEDGHDQLPAIFLSARVSPEDIEAGRSMGALYLTKLYLTSALTHAIEKLLSE